MRVRGGSFAGSSSSERLSHVTLEYSSGRCLNDVLLPPKLTLQSHGRSTFGRDLGHSSVTSCSETALLCIKLSFYEKTHDSQMIVLNLKEFDVIAQRCDFAVVARREKHVSLQV